MNPRISKARVRELYDQELTHSQIAERIGVTPRTITALIQRERKKARDAGLPNPFPYKTMVARHYDDLGLPLET